VLVSDGLSENASQKGGDEEGTNYFHIEGGTEKVGRTTHEGPGREWKKKKGILNPMGKGEKI